LGEWQGGPRAAAGEPLHRLIEAQARLRPAAPALLPAAGREMSYGELDRAARALARELRRRGVGPEVVVGALARRAPATAGGRARARARHGGGDARHLEGRRRLLAARPGLSAGAPGLPAEGLWRAGGAGAGRPRRRRGAAGGGRAAADHLRRRGGAGRQATG